jgi:hypothetical protein
MRRFLLPVVCAAAVVAVAPCLAQTAATNAPPSQGTFIQSVQTYFTVFNPSNSCCFTNSTLSFWVGADSVQGGAVPLANDIGGSFQFWKGLSAEAVARNAGVAGALLSGQGGLGLNLVLVDVRVTPYLDGGYNVYRAAGSRAAPWFGEAGVRVQKALTAHTYGWVGVGAQLPQNAQVFSAGVGFTL